MRVLVACEESAVVAKAFRERGHDSYSCDVIPTSDASWDRHFQKDVREVVDENWDLIIAHPPCTTLTRAGARWLYDPRFPHRREEREEALEFLKMFWNKADKVCIENPVGYPSTAWRKPDQIIQPYQFGHPTSKKTCLWLKNLPALAPTHVVEPRYITTSTGKRSSEWHWQTSNVPRKDRPRVRSKTFEGIAQAMAEQWG